MDVQDERHDGLGSPAMNEMNLAEQEAGFDGRTIDSIKCKTYIYHPSQVKPLAPPKAAALLARIVETRQPRDVIERGNSLKQAKNTENDEHHDQRRRRRRHGKGIRFHSPKSNKADHYAYPIEQPLVSFLDT